MFDPAVRATKKLAEKQRKIEAAKLNAKRMESADNAGQDPCLFTKRTAFDIKMDQGQHMLTYPKYMCSRKFGPVNHFQNKLKYKADMTPIFGKQVYL